MPHRHPWPLLCFSIVGAGLLAGTAMLLSGCGSSDSDVVTAADSKFTAAAPKPDNKKGTDGPNTKSGRTKTSSDRDASDVKTRSGTNDASPRTGSGNRYAASSSDPAEIVSHMERMLGHLDVLASGRSGSSQEETAAAVIDTFKAIVADADRVLASDADSKLRLRAARMKLEVMRPLQRVGQATGKQVQEFCRRLREDDDPEIARFARLALFMEEVTHFAVGETKDYKPILAELNAILADEVLTIDDVHVLRNAAQMLARAGQPEKTDEALRLIATALISSDDKEVALLAQDLYDSALFADVGLLEKMRAATRGELKAEQVAEIVAATNAYLADERIGQIAFSQAAAIARFMAVMEQHDAAKEIYTNIIEVCGSRDSQHAKAALATAENGLRRMKLLGQPINVTGKTGDSKEFDWSKYEGKIVLLAFWQATQEFAGRVRPQLDRIQKTYQKDGVEVIGVNMNDDPSAVQKLLDGLPPDQQMTWTVLYSAESGKNGYENPLAVACGVDVDQFTLLVDREGNIAEVDVLMRPDGIEKAVQKLLKGGESEPGTETKTSPETKTGTESGGSGDAGAKEPAPGGQSLNQQGDAQTFFVAFGAVEDETPTPDNDAQDDNPYLAPTGLSPAELVDLLFEMEDRPKAIQARPGFADALIDAADRVLAADDAKDSHRRVAVLTKFRVLHKHSWDEPKYDKALVEFIEKMKDSQDKRVAAEVQFLQIERRVIEANNDEVMMGDITKVLADAKKYLADQTLTERHVRIADGIVKVINRIDSKDEEKKEELGDLREKYFAEFGDLFSKSKYRQLAKYGKKLATPPDAGGGEQSDLVGKPLELTGATADGAPFDWKSYRGKVVLVDFWATWCGPCRREMPHVKALYEKNKDRGFEVVGVSLDRDLEALAKYVEENKIPWENLAGTGTSALAKKYGVRGIPTMMLIDREGKVVAVSHNIAALKSKAEKLLEAPAAKPKKAES